MTYKQISGGVIRVDDGTQIPNTSEAYAEVQAWVDAGGVITPADVPTQFDADIVRYSKRARAKDQILSEFAAENMARVRAGTWTVPQLIGLTQDAGLKALLDNVNTLSFEIAASMVPGLTNSLLTTEIKAAWVAKLQAHFYN